MTSIEAEKPQTVDPSPLLSIEATCRILGLKSPVPLTPLEMTASLRIAFYPTVSTSSQLANFLERLRGSFLRAGVQVLSYEDALKEGKNGKIGEGIVLIAPGEGTTGNLAIDSVPSLIKNTVVAVLDGTLRHSGGETDLQRRVNGVVSALVWHMAHIVVYVDETTWTVCNMNGAMDTFSISSLEGRLIDSFVPKLACPVVPPQRSDFEFRSQSFDISEFGLVEHVSDLVVASRLWGNKGLLASQTRLDDLAFRNPKYRRIAAAFLSWRTGMSYGFLARQLPTATQPAVDLDDAPARIMRLINWNEKDYCEIDGHLCVVLRLENKRYMVQVPDVAVLCTRSGCEKTRLDPDRDLMKIKLCEGRIIVETPTSVSCNSDSQPSFDTTVIVAHALGNGIVASLAKKLFPKSQFHLRLSNKGLAIAHWHGFLYAAELPTGYISHGADNPPVSCSTPQAAVFALSGKLRAFGNSVQEGIEYLGDVHVEPSHGTNLTGDSLVQLADLVGNT